MPIVMLPRLIASLISLAILALAAYLLWSWFQGYDVLGADRVWRHVRPLDWRLYAGAGLGAWSFLGRFVVLMFIPSAPDEPREQRTEGRTVTAPDGAKLHVETHGLAKGPTLVLTHGWGLNSTAWWYTKQQLGDRFSLTTWDLPGLGRSTPPTDGKYAIDRFAENLGAVVEATGEGKIILVGHSIGGMTTQTFFRACPEAVKRRVAGVVLVDTTYENPIQTMVLSPLWRALRFPLIEPACWLMIALSPLVWLSNWQSYLSGSNHIVMRLTGFGRFATRGQVDLTARLASKGSPGVQAKGNLAMFHWSIREALPTIPVPVLVLAGSKDIVTLPRASQVIAAETPKGRIQIIEGCGHMGFMERAEAYNRAISDFADEVFASHPMAQPHPAIV
ncbi:MAG: alpha/beta fold hydrolase [Caulobacteraceae bacterium]